MTDTQDASGGKPDAVDKLVASLRERARELNCLYRVEEILNGHEATIETVCQKIIEVLPSGCQYPEACGVKIALGGSTYTSPDLVESEMSLSAEIIGEKTPLGSLSIFYSTEMAGREGTPFLPEEQQLIETIAKRLGRFVMLRKLHDLVEADSHTGPAFVAGARSGWRIVLDTLRQTDQGLYINISRKMLNHLCWSGVAAAEALLKTVCVEIDDPEQPEHVRHGPYRKRRPGFKADYNDEVFSIAETCLNEHDILGLIQRWVQEDKLNFLAHVINRNLSLSAVADAIRRFHHLAPDEPQLPSASRRGIQISLIRRFLSDQMPYIAVAKNCIDIDDFYYLLKRTVFTPDSHGKLGGKSAGLFLARQIMRTKAAEQPLLSEIKIPRTWFITSDVLLHFMHFNNFDEVVEQKYKEISQVRLEHPHIVHAFKTAQLPPDIIKGLSMALDDFGEVPLIVRSSSVLEDSIGSAFSGKYQSLFLANQGKKQDRLDALTDAIAEVYASTFGPDPIEYRAQRGLLDFGEEMGILIQEVVGNRIGDYFLPAFAGVAFSHNELRWSARIRRNDGLVRMVPGLGTRAVDRLSNDYPVLLAPGQPGLRVNQAPEEISFYSPRQIDVINLKTNQFETLDLREFLRTYGAEYPAINRLVSIIGDGRVSEPVGSHIDFENEEVAVTFEGLVKKTPFLRQMKEILATLEKELHLPVDIEFAHDGRDFYLLQCRAQSDAEQARPDRIPDDVPADKTVFTANKYISNGRIPELTHIVYVDPRKYGELSSREQMMRVGRAVGRLNTILPKRRFALLGPGRWGSRGDIKLGVSVNYSDINNTAALIEIARRKEQYLPDVSFGTHFFQDLVESNIRYLPLYPDEPGIIFNEAFFSDSDNLLAELVPDAADLQDVIHVIDVPAVSGGRILRILLNSRLERALGYLDDSTSPLEYSVTDPNRVDGEDR